MLITAFVGGWIAKGMLLARSVIVLVNEEIAFDLLPARFVLDLSRDVIVISSRLARFVLAPARGGIAIVLHLARLLERKSCSSSSSSKERCGSTSGNKEDRRKKSEGESLQKKIRRSKTTILNKRREEIKLVLLSFRSQMRKNEGLGNNSDEMPSYSNHDNEGRLDCGSGFPKGKELGQISVDAFCKKTQYYTQCFEFIDYLKDECEFIKVFCNEFKRFDSCAKDVYHSRNQSLERFNLLDDSSINDMLEVHIHEFKVKDQDELEYEFCLYLTECDFITCDSDTSEIIRTLNKDQKFKDKRLTSLEIVRLEMCLDDYIYFCARGFNQRSDMVEKYKEGKKKFFESGLFCRGWDASIATGSLEELVHKAYSMGFIMHEDPVMEILKNPSWGHYVK